MTASFNLGWCREEVHPAGKLAVTASPLSHGADKLQAENLIAGLISLKKAEQSSALCESSQPLT